jgi:hypothetical protein
MLAQAVEICREFWEDRERFDREERGYKLQVAERTRAALSAAAGGGEYIPLLKKAFQSPNNLTSHRVHGPFANWAQAEPEEARLLLGSFMNPVDPAQQVDGFLDGLPHEVVRGAGNRLSLASFFVFGQAPGAHPVYRTTAVEPVERLLGFPEPHGAASPGEVYAHHLAFFREMESVLREAGIPLRDTLDAQSFVYLLAKNDRPQVAAWRDGTIDDGNGHVNGDAELDALVARFREEDGYPTSEDQSDLRAREEFQADLRELVDAETPDWRKLQFIISTGVYGNPGPQPILNDTINRLDEAESRRLQATLRHLLDPDRPLADRLDGIQSGPQKIRGLGESGAVKLLSIMQPDTVLPVFPSRGGKGKAALMTSSALRLAPPRFLSPGQYASETNELLRERLAPFFGTDTHGMKRFLYWLAGQKQPPPSDFQQLADDLLLPLEFIEEVAELLRERRQIILYGPPGTGKTYVARALMRQLAPARHAVVQFHPSYSYEDFFQGYRPVLRDDGQLSYDLKPGPLMRLARAAAEDPEHEYVLLIDEINRGNLPKIFGELLYLLEYRGDTVTPMYGAEGEEFSLPENLLVIGTMNTADRSIALVDAALRRRFHFVSLFPGEGPLHGFLERWLAKHKPEMAHVAGLVDRLNDELKARLNAHQQVGHSYFTRRDLSERTLERVWAHDIMPFLQDQLFGQEPELERFTLKALRGGDDADHNAAGVPAGDVGAQPG